VLVRNLVKLMTTADDHSVSKHKTQVSKLNRRKVCTLCHISLYTVCLKKNIPDVFSYNSRKHCRIFIIFGTNITEKASNQKMLYFPPHLINAPTLPCETENTEIVSFHVNVSCWFASRTRVISKLSPNHC